MRSGLSLLFILGFVYLNAQGVFDASIHTAVAIGSVSSPAAEGVQNVIDQDESTKFLDFNAADGIGFEVDLLGTSVVVTSMSFVTANDAPERDPMMFTISGSNDGTNFTQITSGEIPCVPDRFLSRTISFDNTVSYSYFRLEFVENCSPANIFQIADVQLFSVIGNAPVFNCPGNITIENDMSDCGGVVNFDISANDEEDGVLDIILESGFPSGSSFPVGITPIIYSTEDSDGNKVNCYFEVEVLDTELPEGGCPSDITVNISSNENSAIVEYEVLPLDNCSVINPKDNFIPLVNLNNQVYYLSNTFITPFDAWLDSELEEGFLGTIRSEEDNNTILKSIAALGGSLEVTIGYSDMDEEGNFQWLSGDNSTYTNWNPGEPNDALSGEDFTVMQTNGGWNDIAGDGGNFLYLFETIYVPIQIEGLESGEDFPIGVTTNTFEIYDLAGNVTSCSFDVTVSNMTHSIETEDNNYFKIYPNPSTHSVHIQNEEKRLIEKLCVTNMLGELVYQLDVHSTDEVEIDVQNLKSGIYFVSVFSEEEEWSSKFCRL